MKKVWFITGSARRLGRSLAQAVLANGDYLAATARNPEQLGDLVGAYHNQILPIGLDVTDAAQVKEAVNAAIKHFGRIDVLVNNAGFGIIGAAEWYTPEQVRSQLETNLYAPIEITRQVLPHMRKQRGGRIIQISSVGGRVGSIGLTMYQAAKFGVGGFTEAIAGEVAPLGIKVTSVEPGGFRTDWAGASMSYAPSVEGYETTVGQRADYIAGGKFTPNGDPDKAAQAILALADHPEPPLHLVLGSDAAAIVQQADQRRKAEFEKWLAVTQSTDHHDATSFADTALGKQIMQKGA